MAATPTIERVCAQIADLAKVPLPNRVWYEKLVASLIRDATRDSVREAAGKALGKDEVQIRKSLARISKAAELLAGALRDRSLGADNTLRWEFMNWRLENKGIVLNESQLAYGEFLDTILSLSPIAAKSAASYKQRPRGRGAPRGIRNMPATVFTHMLLLWTYKAGGDLTLDATSQTGGLVKAMDCCRPVMRPPFRFLSPSSMAPLYAALANERTAAREKSRQIKLDK